MEEISQQVVGAVRGNNALWFAASDAAGSVAYDATNLPFQVNTRVPCRHYRRQQSTCTNSRSNKHCTITSSNSTASNVHLQGSQPLLVPVPQLMGVTAVTGSAPYDPRGTKTVQETGWIPQAVKTTFNLIVGAGDTPSRALNTASGDFNGGLQNLPRFLETVAHRNKFNF